MKKTFTFEIGAGRQANHRFSSHLQPKVDNSLNASDSIFAVMPLSEDSPFVNAPSNYLLDSPNEQDPSSEFYQLNIQQMNLFTYLTRAANNLFQLRGASNMGATLLSKSRKVKSVLDLCESWGLSTLTNRLTSNKKEQLSASSLNGFSTLRTVFASLILTVLTAWTAVASPDLSLTATISNGNPNPGDLVTYIIKLKNSTGDKATNISVKDSLPSTLESIVYSSPASGVTYDNVNKKWVITQLLGNTEITLQVQARVKSGDLGRGIAYASFEVVAQTEPDADSKPNNHNINEDDQAAVCFSVPTYFSTGSVFEVSVPKGLTNVVWTRRVGTNGVATAITATASGSGAYIQNGVLYVESITDYTEFTYSATNSTCPVTGCCPVKFIPDPYGSIGDYVWSDVNANGIQDATETGLSGIKVDLYTSANTFVKTVTTTSTGYYLFDNLTSGTYQVRVTLPSKSQISKANQGSDDTKDSDFSALGRSHLVTINTALAVTDTLRNNPNVDAGIVPLGSIGDYVFNDNNKDGIQNTGDTPVAGLKVSLLDKNGNVISTTTTDANGKYEFIVASGQYYVLFDKPAGSTFTLTGKGTSSTDSDAGTDGKSPLITIDATKPVGDPARDNKDIDAGIIPSCNVTTGNLLAGTSGLCLPTGGSLTLTASVSTAPTVPTGYVVRYLLSKGTTNVIVQTATTPSFSVNVADSYKIHTIVYNATDLNLTTAITLGTTKLSDLQTSISGKCLALDATGVSFNVTSNPDMPNVIASASTLCAGDVATLTASGTGSSYKWYTLPTGGTAFATTASVQVTPTANTTYYVETVNANSCTSARKSISIIVNTKPTTPTVLASLANQCSPVATTTVNLASAITSTPSTSGGVFEWRTGSASTSSLVANPAAVGAGTYYLFEKSTTGCYSTPALVTVNINSCACPNPATVILAAIPSQCVGSFTQLQLSATLGGGATSGTWTSTGTGTFDNVSSVSAKYTPSASDETKGSIEFTFTTNDPDGSATLCSAATSKTTFIYKARPSKPSNLSASSQICLGQPNTLTAESAGNTIKWYTTATGGTPVGTGTSLTVTPTAAGTVMYYAEASTSEGCTSERASINFTVNPSPTTPTVLASLANQCSPVATTTVNLASAITSTPSTSGGVFEWRTGSTSTSSLVANPATVGAGTYYLFEKSTNGCYSAPAVVTVNINSCSCPNPATVTVATISSQCVGSFTQLQLSATLGGGATSGTWTSTGTGTFDNVSSVSAKYTPSASDETKGLIEFTFTTNDPDGSATLCSAATSKTVFTYKARPSKPSNLSASSQICLGQPNTLTAESAGNTIKWYTTATGGTSVGTGTSLTVTPTAAGTVMYYAEAVTPEGCISERASINFTVTSCQTTDLAVVKTVVDVASPQTTPSYLVGQTINYAIVAKNLGGSSASTVKVKDVLPASLSFVSADPSAQYNASTGEWTIGTLAAGAQVTLNIKATILSKGSIVNDAEISSPSEDPTKLGNNKASVTINAIELADLSLTKTVSNATPNVNDEIVYTIVVSNAGPHAATNVEIQDVLPAGISFVSSTSLTNNNGTLTGTIANLAKDAKVEFTFRAKVTSGGKITNAAQITKSDVKDPDSTPNNGTDKNEDDDDSVDIITPTVCNVAAPVLAAEKTAICSGQSVNITAVGCTGQIKWNTGETTASITVTPSVNATYTATCTVNNCTSNPSTPVSITVTTPTVPTITASSTSICGSGSVTLTATGCTGTVKWYGGAQALTGASVTVNPTVTTTYSATCTVASCESTKSQTVTITVGTPTPPAISPALSAICSGSPLTLSATGCAGGTIEWSNGMTGSSITVTPTASTNYTAVCKMGTCTSTASNTASVTVSEFAKPTIVASKTAICVGESVTLTATGCTGTIKWSDGQTGASVTIKPTVTTSYTATCTSTNATCNSGVSNTIEVKVNSGSVDAPIVVCGDQEICVGQEVVFLALGCPSGTTVKWSNGMTGSSITVKPTITTVYSAVCSLGACESVKSNEKEIVVKPTVVVTLVASADKNNVCAGSPVTLTVKGCEAGKVTWTGGLTGSTITVNPTVTTTYTALCTDVACATDAKASVTVNVATDLPTPVIVASTTSPVCAGTEVTLTATGCTADLLWSTGETTASIKVKPSITTTYTVQCKSNSCANATAKTSSPVTVTVGSGVAPVITASTTTICSGSQVTLTATGCGASDVTWSNGKTGASIIETPTATTTYSATCKGNTCVSAESNKVTVNVTPLAIPTISVVCTCPAKFMCPGSSMTLVATGCEGGTIKWSDGFTGSIHTVSPTQTTNYTVKCVTSTCESASSAVTTITVGTPTAPVITSDVLTACAGSLVNLTATGCDGAVIWSDGQIGTTVSVKPTANTTYTAICKLDKCESGNSNELTINVGNSASKPSTKDLVNACPATTVDLTSGLLSTASNGSSFEFRTGTSSTSTLVSNPQAVSATGTYYVFEKFASGCYSAPAAINVFINTDCSTKNCTTAPAAVNAGADATICDTKSYQLKGAFSGAASFITWKSTGTGTFDNPLLPTATYTASAQDVTNGSVKLFLTSNDPDGTGPCVAAVDTMILTINGIKVKPTITVSGNLTACTTDSVGLKAIAGYQYKWYKVGSTSVVSTAQTINVKGLGSYYYILSDANGCTSVPSDTATLNPLADISAPVTKNLMISSGQTANLNSLVTSTTPTGATLVFKSGGSAASNDVATPSAVGFGTYYAFYRTAQGCFSSGSPITVSTDLVVMDLADIGVGITTDKATYAVGDTVVTTVKVVNSGPRTAKGVALSVIIPGTLTYASQTGGLIQNGNTVGVNIDTLAMNGTKTYTFKSVVTSTSEATITVSATSSTVDPNTANNKASVTINAGVVDPNAADAAIAIVADKTAIGLNETTTLTVTVSNNGPATAKGVKVTTSIPAGFELLSAEPSWIVNGNTLTASYDSLKKGETKVLTFIAKGITSGNLLFGATVASTLDPKTDNNTATTTVQVGTINPTGFADLAVSFTTDKSIVSKGDEVVYTMKVQNNGPAAASSIELRALFPQGLTFISGDVTKTTDSVKATINNLAVGASTSFSYRVKVDEDKTISTTVTTTKYSPTDPVLTNNTATATIVSANDTLYADLSVIKTASATTVNKDSLVTYTIKVTNAGPGNAKNVVLKDFLVSNLSYISGDFTSTGKTATGDSLSATIASIAKGETKSLTYSARAVLQGVAPNTVFVASSSKLDAVKGNDKSTVEVNIINRVVNDCKLGLALAVIDTNQISTGVYKVTYQLIAKNFCRDTLRNVSLVDSVAKNFPSPATFTVSAPVLKNTGNLVINEAFGASDPNLVKAASSFMIPNKVDTLIYTVTLTLNGNKGPFYSQVNGSGIAPSGTVTAKSSAGTNVSATPSRTVVRFDLPRTLIGVAKEVLASGLKRESTNEWTVPYVIRVVNMGVNRITKLSVTDDLDAVYTSKGATIVGQPTVSTNRPGVKVNSKYTGSGLNIDLVLPDSSALGVGDSVSINLVVRVNTTAATDSVFSNVAIGKGTGTDGLTYEDISTAGSDPDPDKDGDPSNNKVATSVTLSNPVKPLGDAAIGVALSASKPVIQSDSTFNVKFKLIARNYGKDTLNNVVLANHIQSNIGQQVTAWSLVGKPTLVSGKVKLDSLFDGIADTTLTVASSTFKFAKGDSIVIEYTLNIREPLQDTIYTQASATGISIADATKKAFDLSTAGTNPDPNGDGNPAENAKTPVIFDASVVTDSPFIPEGFSPNGDGINDKFVIQPLNPDHRIELKIFNRWGSLVYASSDYKNEWGGEANQGVKVIGDGQGLPDGTYFYSFTRYDRTTGEIILTQGKNTVVKYFTVVR